MIDEKKLKLDREGAEAAWADKDHGVRLMSDETGMQALFTYDARTLAPVIYIAHCDLVTGRSPLRGAVLESLEGK